MDLRFFNAILIILLLYVIHNNKVGKLKGFVMFITFESFDCQPKFNKKYVPANRPEGFKNLMCLWDSYT